MDKFNIINQIKLKSTIAGISSEEVSFVKSLVDNKCKDSTKFVCEGLWAIDKLINKNLEVSSFFVCSERLETTEDEKELEQVLKMANYAKKTYLVSRKACNKISDREGADEYFIVVSAKSYTLDDLTKLYANKTEVLAAVTDGLEQPGNIGAIIRSVDAAGGDFVIITNSKAKINNSRLVRASLGASFMMPVLSAPIEDVQSWLVKNNFKCLVTDLSATKSFKEADFKGRIAVVGGNEHTGISDSWRHLPNAERIIIPMLGSCESLNVGFATTLVTYEIGLKKHNK